MGKPKAVGNRNEVQKQKSRVAAKVRRKKENEQFDELVPMLPWISSNPPDKCSVIRFATSFVGLKQVLDGSQNNKCIANGQTTGKGVEHLALEALDGFVIVLSKKGSILFVNENVQTYVGYHQRELLGRSIYNLVLKKDWDIVAEKIRGPLPSLHNPNIKQPDVNKDDEICELSGTEMFTPLFQNNNAEQRADNPNVKFSVRVQCNSLRKSCKGSDFKVLRFNGRIESTGNFIGLVQPVWSPDVGDLPVQTSAFISRLTPDLKLMFCEGRIHRYMDSEAKDIVGRVVYPFYHPKDIFHLQKMHSSLLAKGQCVTEPYRWMNKDGGWVWLESKLRLIKCEKTGQRILLCVNYVLSAVENRGVVLGVLPPTEETLIETDRKESEHDSNDAHIYDPRIDSLTQEVEGWNINGTNNTSHPEIKYEDPPTAMPYYIPEQYESTSSNVEPQSLPSEQQPQQQQLPQQLPEQLPHQIDYSVPENAAFIAAEILTSDLVQGLLTPFCPSPTSKTPSYFTHEPDTLTPAPTGSSSHSQDNYFDDFTDLLTNITDQTPCTNAFNGSTNQSMIWDKNENNGGFLYGSVEDFNEFSLLDFDTTFCNSELTVPNLCELDRRPGFTVEPTADVAYENNGRLITSHIPNDMQGI